MDEREHHDQFYQNEAGQIFDTPLFSEVRRRMAAFVLSSAKLGTSDRVLSLGSGDGRVECLLAPHVAEVIGVELSPVAVEQSRARAEALGLKNARFEVGDIEKPLRYEAASFKAVISLGVLHHVSAEDTRRLLVESLEILAPGGFFISNDPSSRRLVGAFKALFSKQYDRFHSPDEGELNPDTLAEIFRSAGYSPATVRYNDFFLGPFSWLFPRFPSGLTSVVVATESVLLAVPGLRRFSSGFCVVAQKP